MIFRCYHSQGPKFVTILLQVQKMEPLDLVSALNSSVFLNFTGMLSGALWTAIYVPCLSSIVVLYTSCN